MFEDLKLLNRDNWRRLVERLESLKISGGPGIRVARSIGGTTVTSSARKVGESSAAECLLGDLSADPVNLGAKIIKPGYISGGGSSVFLEKNNITPTIDQHLYVAVPWTANVEDDVILEGGTMGTPTISQGASIPSDVLPTVGSPSGTAYIPLGTWTASSSDPPTPKWNHAGCGSISIKFCPGGGFYWIRGESY